MIFYAFSSFLTLTRQFLVPCRFSPPWFPDAQKVVALAYFIRAEVRVQLPLSWRCLMAIAILRQVALVIEAHTYIWHGFLVLLVLLIKKK